MLSKLKKNHFPQSVMVWAGISGLGKTKLVFVPKGVKINAKTYKKHVLESTVISRANKYAKNTIPVLQGKQLV